MAGIRSLAASPRQTKALPPLMVPVEIFAGCFRGDTSRIGTGTSPGTAGLRDLPGRTREVASHHINPIIFYFFFSHSPHSTKIKKPSIS